MLTESRPSPKSAGKSPMKDSTPHPAMLDDMQLDIQQVSGPEDWQDLVSSPNATREWNAATQRRQRVDQIAAVVLQHPWMAKILLRISEKCRALGQAGASPFRLARTQSPVQVTLDAGPPNDIPTDVYWGKPCIIELHVGDGVRFRGPNVSSFIYRRIADEGRATGWQMETGDGPTVIVGAEVRVESLEQMFAADVPMAIFILIERNGEKIRL